jgi:hypothetical protein
MMVSCSGDKLPRVISGGDVPIGIANLGGDISIVNPDVDGANLGDENVFVSMANPDFDGINLAGLVSMANPDFDGINLGGDSGPVSIDKMGFFGFLVIFDPVSIGEKLPVSIGENLRGFIILYCFKIKNNLL